MWLGLEYFRKNVRAYLMKNITFQYLIISLQYETQGALGQMMLWTFFFCLPQ